MERGTTAQLVRICDAAGRPLGTGFTADGQGTVVTGIEVIGALEASGGPGSRTAVTVRAADGERPRPLAPGGLVLLPASGLALLRTGGSVPGTLPPPLPVSARAGIEPGTYVRVRAHGAWREARVLGARGPGGTILDLVMGADARDALRIGGEAGGPVLDAVTGAVLAVLGPPPSDPDGGSVPAYRLLPPGDAAGAGALAVLLRRNAACAPAHGADLNLAGVVELTRALGAVPPGGGCGGAAPGAPGPAPVTVSPAVAAGGPAAAWAEPVERPEVARQLPAFPDRPPVVRALVGDPGTGRTTELAALAARRAQDPAPGPTLWLRGADLRREDASVEDALARALGRASRVRAASRRRSLGGGAGAGAGVGAGAARPEVVAAGGGAGAGAAGGAARTRVPVAGPAARAGGPGGGVAAHAGVPGADAPPSAEAEVVGPGRAARVAEAAGRPLLVVLDGPEEMPLTGERFASWAARTRDWLTRHGAQLVIGCGPAHWEEAAALYGAAAAPVRIGLLTAAQAATARARHGLPDDALAGPDARHPLTLRLLAEVRAAQAAHGDDPGGPVPDRAEVFAAWLDLVALRVAGRVAAAAPGPVRGTAVRRLAARAAGRVHELARHCLGSGGHIPREAFETHFPWRDGWAAAVLSEGLVVPAGGGYRFAHEEFADWIQGVHLDLDAALRKLVHRAPAGPPVPRHRHGPVRHALLLTERRHGPAALAAHLAALVRSLTPAPGDAPPAREPHGASGGPYVCSPHGQPHGEHVHQPYERPAQGQPHGEHVRQPNESPYGTRHGEPAREQPCGGHVHGQRVHGLCEQSWGESYGQPPHGLYGQPCGDHPHDEPAPDPSPHRSCGQPPAEQASRPHGPQGEPAHGQPCGGHVHGQRVHGLCEQSWGESYGQPPHGLYGQPCGNDPHEEPAPAQRAQPRGARVRQAPAQQPHAEPRWWAARLLGEVLPRLRDAEPYAAVLRALAARVAADGRDRDAFGPAFWASLVLGDRTLLDLLRRLLPADPAPDGTAGANGAPRHLDLAAERLAADPEAVQPLLCAWFADDTPLDTPFATGRAAGVRPTVAAAAQALLYARRDRAPDSLAEALLATEHPRARELLGALADDHPSAYCRAVHRRAADHRPERRAVAALHLPAADARAGAGADRALLRSAARALLADGVHAPVALALLVRDPAGRDDHLDAALALFRAGGLPPETFTDALRSHPGPVLAAFRSRLLAPGAEDGGVLTAVLAEATTPCTARPVAALICEYVDQRPEAGAHAAAYVDIRLERPPVDRAVLVPLVTRLMRARPVRVRSALAPVLAAPGSPLSRALRAELLDALLGYEQYAARDLEVLEAVLRTAALTCETPARPETREVVHRAGLVLVRTPLGASRLDLLLVDLAHRSGAFAAALGRWTAEAPDAWDLVAGPLTWRMLAEAAARPPQEPMPGGGSGHGSLRPAQSVITHTGSGEERSQCSAGVAWRTSPRTGDAASSPSAPTTGCTAATS
ncbi:serine protease [Streptomyces sp. NPDC005805]|uniref:serine protease n=1 Tax=Streptomyces sp. NPDC005805 TaxID=3157068 RepID=UPI0033BFBF10